MHKLRNFIFALTLICGIIGVGYAQEITPGNGGLLAGTNEWTGTNTFDAAITIDKSAFATTSTTGLSLTNLTAATAGVPVQYSPRTKWCGAAWNSVSVASELDCWIAELQPINAAGATGASWVLSRSIAGGAYNTTLLIDKNGNIVPNSAAGIYWGSRSSISSPSDGVFLLENNATTDFSRLQFGGTSASFPSWKRSSAGFVARTADDGGNTFVVASDLQFSGGLKTDSGSLLVSKTAPTVSAGFGSGSAGTVTKNTGTFAVQVTVGTNAGGTTGTLTFPSAPTGWACHLEDVTNPADLTRQTGYTQTTAAYLTTVAWTTGDVLVGICGPF